MEQGDAYCLVIIFSLLLPSSSQLDKTMGYGSHLAGRMMQSDSEIAAVIQQCNDNPSTPCCNLVLDGYQDCQSEFSNGIPSPSSVCTSTCAQKLRKGRRSGEIVDGGVCPLVNLVMSQVDLMCETGITGDNCVTNFNSLKAVANSARPDFSASQETLKNTCEGGVDSCLMKLKRTYRRMVDISIKMQKASQSSRRLQTPGSPGFTETTDVYALGLDLICMRANNEYCIPAISDILFAFTDDDSQTITTTQYDALCSPCGRGIASIAAKRKGRAYMNDKIGYACGKRASDNKYCGQIVESMALTLLDTC